MWRRARNEGVTPTQHEIKQASDTAQVLFDDVLVPADQLVGEKEGEGLRQANEVFGFTRLMVAAFGLGAGTASLRKAIAYSKQRRQHAMFECATSIVEVETAVALVRAVGLSEDPLSHAQARVWASEVALSASVRLLKLFQASGVLDAPTFGAFETAADLKGAIGSQSGRLADLDFIARAITS